MASFLPAAALLAFLVAPVVAADAAEARVVKVVELFQSRNCPTCPQAQANLDALTRQADLLALSYPVALFPDPEDKDAQPEFLARQRAYVESIGDDGVYTPQMVLNGRLAFPGAEAGRVAATLAHATDIEARPTLAQASGRLEVRGGVAARRHRLWLVSYRPLAAGPSGRQARRINPAVARNIVVDIRALGAWSGQRAAFRLPPPLAGTQRAVLLQEGEAGPILAALELSR